MKARVFLPAVVSGVLLWTAFFPLDLGPVALVAMAPFLTLVRAEGVGPWRRYLAAFAGGLVFAVLALKWIRVAHPMMALFAWPGLSLFLALYWPLALLLMRKLDRLGLPLAVTFPVVWVALEYFRAHFPTGYPFMSAIHAHQLTGFGWYDLGYAMHDVLPMIQAADLGGVYLVSAAVAAVNGAAYEWLIRSAAVRWLLRWPPLLDRRTCVREMTVTAGAVVLPLGLLCYGAVRLTHLPFEAGPRIAAIQGNLPQNEKMIKGDEGDATAETPLEREYLPLAAQAALPGGNDPRPDLVIWPETCFPVDWLVVGDDNPPGTVPDGAAQYAGRVAAAVSGYAKNQMRTNVLLGLNSIEWHDGRQRKYNSALLVRGDGTVGGRYDKIHLVPWGEYVPLREQLPWLQSFTPYRHDYSCTPGENWTRFELPTPRGTFRFGVLICYEDSDPYLARQYNPASGSGPGADFLVNISNDGWFDGTEEHEQHLAICRFRAVEARRSVVRAVNMGISGVIDPDGRVVALPAETWSASKKMAKGQVVRADVPVDRRETVYAAVGDWVPALCWAGSGVGGGGAGGRGAGGAPGPRPAPGRGRGAGAAARRG